ncbi:MAG: hypothetical protein FJ405_14975, partial [Verrucomicrobia bacterium]|nr:hypothetical protein [Verrucomicrobiota bacterium]
MIGALRSLLQRWTWVMAWRESRSRRARLALFASSMILGAAALIAIGSFRDAVLESVEEQSKALLGADLVLSGRSRFGAEEEALFQTL